MVFNGEAVLAVATLSADLCQYVAFNPEHLDARYVLRLLCCLPLRHLARFALCLCSFLCLPSSSPRLSPLYHSSSDEEEEEDDGERDYVHDPHSD